MDAFEYSDEFKHLVVRLHRGMEKWPFYESYLSDHLGGPQSRVVRFANCFCREVEYHCGSMIGMRVLDFGCGTGASTVALAQYAKEVCAFDIDQESLEVCKMRVREHGLGSKVTFFTADDIASVRDSMGVFDLVVADGVIEHIPLSKKGLRKGIVRSLFQMLKTPGFLVVDDTPNRLWPIDFHSTSLWWIPWTKPGSKWAYKRATKKTRHSDTPRNSKGPLGLEERGAWGVTYWEIMEYLEGEDVLCVNTTPGHNRHFRYFSPPSKGKAIPEIFDFGMYNTVVKFCHLPIVAFCPMLNCLVIKKCGNP